MTSNRLAPDRADRVAAEARKVLAQRSKSFRLASNFLPARVRRDVAVVYAFCRIVDDAADDAESEGAGHRRLAELRAMLLGRRDANDLVRAFRETAFSRGFGLEPALELLAGVESDLDRVRIEDDAELLTYCYRVAGTVGSMMCGVLGVTEPIARSCALQLGMAMQLTNICRDVQEDARLGRVYLPKRRLAAAGLDPQQAEPDVLLHPGPTQASAVRETVLGLLQDAERLYALASAGFFHIPLWPRFSIIVGAHLYRAIGRRLASRGGDALAGRTVVPGWEKGLLVAAAAAVWLRTILVPKRRALLLGSLHPSQARPSAVPLLADVSRP